MTESMKFGPEWLRNLSETPVQPQMRYQLAEYRYGKEEMLALFSPNLQPPDFLKTVVPKGVYIEKAQQPLTLTTMTDEETRVWNRGINSDIMLPRTVGKGEGRGGLRGAGGGRGRARGSGSFYGGRGGGMIGYDDLDPGIRYGERPTRPFERSQSEREQRWSDRNGGEGRGGASGAAGNRNSEGNWRRSRGDDEDWRPSKWSANNQYRTNNWREEDNWEMPTSQKGGNLPEWATEKNSEGGGTFDSSGAFRSEMPLEDEEEVRQKEKTYKKTEKIQQKPEKEETTVQKEEKTESAPVKETPPKPPPKQPKQPEQPPETKKPDLTDLHLDDTYGMTDDLAADLVKLIDDEDEEKKSKQWFYRDPQGEIQGPFTCNEMAEWFSSGYFSLSLLVRRACDSHYAPLGDLIANWGFIPFLPENHPLNKEGNLANHQKEQFYQQQQRLMMMRNRSANKFPEWDPMEQSFQQLPPHVVNNNNLRALLAQMQQQQQQQSSTSQFVHQQMPKPSMPPPRTTEEISRTLNDFLQSLQAKSEQQAVAQAQQSGIESLLNFQQPPPQPGNSTAIQNLLRKMQASHQNKMQVNSNMETIWNGVNWNQWNNSSNPKGIKTEQQVLEEQLRAEDERMREELRKHEEAKRKMDEEEEKKHRNHALREAEELSRRQQEEEDLRRKQEASRRAEVERQRKGEEKRKKDEEKRKLEQEKKERERLREEERKKKEAEEAKKKANADLMAKVQKSQWCPPAASHTSILDIQRSEREQQQLLRTLQQQQVEQQKPNASVSMQLKWTETQRVQKQPVQSLADIQAEQYEQLLKVEKEKQEREKEKGVVQQTMGSWSQGLTWGTGIMPASSVWQGVNSNSTQSSGGFWEHIGNPSKPTENPQPQKNLASTQPIGPSAPTKEPKSKAKREEVGVLKLFNNCHYDEFTQWCSTTLLNMQSTVDIPTFVSFLRDIESASEVQEYIQEYLGDEKDAKDFAKQFIERRSRLGTNSISSQNHQSPPSKEDFQQVKSKSKKAKKNKMQKVDNRILGFSTTSAPDRINVGDREYPDDI